MYTMGKCNAFGYVTFCVRHHVRHRVACCVMFPLIRHMTSYMTIDVSCDKLIIKMEDDPTRQPQSKQNCWAT